MDLTAFVTKTSLQFKEQADLQTRRGFANALAARYKIEPPEVILMFTHPELRQLPLYDRCQAIGITEECFLLVSMQPGFQKFLQDMQQTYTGALRIQATEKLSTTIQKERFKFDKMGNASEIVDAEIEIHKALVSENKSAPQVNVQFNMFDQARQKAIKVLP